jgi:hypothetical protein
MIYCDSKRDGVFFLSRFSLTKSSHRIVSRFSSQFYECNNRFERPHKNLMAAFYMEICITFAGEASNMKYIAPWLYFTIPRNSYRLRYVPTKVSRRTVGVVRDCGNIKIDCARLIYTIIPMTNGGKLIIHLYIPWSSS